MKSADNTYITAMAAIATASNVKQIYCSINENVRSTNNLGVNSIIFCKMLFTDILSCTVSTVFLGCNSQLIYGVFLINIIPKTKAGIA